MRSYDSTAMIFLKEIKLIDAFDENDDIHNVYHNIEMTDEIADALAEA